MDDVLLANTGHPAAIASSGGNPNPSQSDGYTNSFAPAYASPSNSSEVTGMLNTQSLRPKSAINPVSAVVSGPPPSTSKSSESCSPDSRNAFSSPSKFL